MKTPQLLKTPIKNLQEGDLFAFHIKHHSETDENDEPFPDRFVFAQFIWQLDEFIEIDYLWDEDSLVSDSIRVEALGEEQVIILRPRYYNHDSKI